MGESPSGASSLAARSCCLNWAVCLSTAGCVASSKQAAPEPGSREAQTLAGYCQRLCSVFCALEETTPATEALIFLRDAPVQGLPAFFFFPVPPFFVFVLGSETGSMSGSVCVQTCGSLSLLPLTGVYKLPCRSMPPEPGLGPTGYLQPPAALATFS